MFLPFRMTWSLQMPRSEKLGIFTLFGSGWICIVRRSDPTFPVYNHTNVIHWNSYSPHSVSFRLVSRTEYQRPQIQNGCRCGLSSKPLWVHPFTAPTAIQSANLHFSCHHWVCPSLRRDYKKPFRYSSCLLRLPRIRHAIKRGYQDEERGK